MKNKLSLIITLITLFIFLSTTVGYAVYNASVSFTGNLVIKGNGEIAITNVILSSYSNLQNPENPSYTKDSVNFNLDFRVASNSNLDDDFSATYDITISNTTFFDYEFASTIFNPSVETTENENMNVSYEVVNIEIGDIIPSNTTKTFSLIIHMYPKTPGNYNVSGDTDVNVENNNETQTGTLVGSIPKNTTVNLRNGNVRGKVTVSVLNSYETAKSFNINTNNSNFKVVDSSGNSLGSFSIPANTTQDFDVYIEAKSGVSFASDSQSLNLLFNTNEGNISMGSVNVLVTKDETLLDDDAPIISDVNATYVAENGRVDLTWSATDISDITNFIVEVYNGSDQLVNTYNTNSNSRNYSVSGLSNGTYYFRVYGVDSKNNNGKNQATTCTTDEGKCSRSTSSSYKWVYTVTYSLSNGLSTTSSREAVINTQYTGKITASGNYRLPSSITIRMNGERLYSGYTYDSDNGNITINNVTGDITITAQGTSTGGGICLVEGTKILLSNGKYKNIENITYNDLLSVWSYDSGSITSEYPIWLEKTSSISSYQKNTFSDGTVLNTVGFHGIFSSTYNQFISVDDYEKFKVGTKVYKVENGKLKEVEIVKIEKINKEVNYYHVVSTRYYNVIANDLLTTDGTVILSNLYGFDKNVTWPKQVRNSLISDKNNLYDYSEFSDFMPYYMFNGLRAEEGKILNRYGLDKNTFRYYLINNQMNKDMLLDVDMNEKEIRLWMVTTDKDNIFNKKNYLYEEGSYYTLPLELGVKSWYSTSEDKYYKPLEKVKVNHAMHFVSVK